MMRSPAKDRPIDRDRADRGDLVARDRQRFLAGEPLDPARVRGDILASWRRSREQDVAADRVVHTFQDDIDPEMGLTRSARPVLRALREQMEGQAVSIILSDHTGLVLSRSSGEPELDRYLDMVELAPGFCYGEDSVGTNGIGTALEMGGPVAVLGHEHYVENLERLSCVAVPIKHPVTGRTVGVLNLTCWTRDAGPLLLSLAKNAVAQIRQELTAGAGDGQLKLLQAYLRASRRSSGIVFAVTGDTVILGDSVRTRLSPDDQSAMVTHALESLVNGKRRQIDIDLPSGTRARLQAQSVGEDEKGTVVSVSLAEAWTGRGPNIEHSSEAGLPGIVGTDPVWAHCCREVETAARNGEWLVVRGERGVGKLAVLRAVHLRLHPGSQVTVLDAAAEHTASAWARELAAALDGSCTGVVITHVEALDVNRLYATAEALQVARARPDSDLRWVAATLGNGADELNLLPLLDLFPRTVDVPPLRLHLRDLPLLVPHLLRRIDPHGHLTYSAEVIATMVRGSWTGNVTELDGVLREIAAHRRSGEIVLEDLPPAARTVSRRRLTHIEALERDAVVAALQQAHGDKTRAAKALGMSRATIYRKIRDYGILAPVRPLSQG